MRLVALLLLESCHSDISLGFSTSSKMAVSSENSSLMFQYKAASSEIQIFVVPAQCGIQLNSEL